MDNAKTFDEKIDDLKRIDNLNHFKPSLVSAQSLDQLISGHQLKYVENLIEVEEENKLAQTNIDDFLALSSDIQEAALEVFDKAKFDPEYFNREGANKDLMLPVQILANIATKKNEAKIKTWKVDYHARLISRLREFKKSGLKKGWLSLKGLFALFVK